MTHPTIVRVTVALLATVTTLAAPHPLDAQFGRLKRAVAGVHQDSATRAANAAKDSAARANGDTSSSASSRLGSVLHAARKATDRLEDATGVSVKDAALAASGVGLGSIAAKKLGLDPMALLSASQAGRSGRTVPGVAMQGNAAAGFGSADAQIMALVQQEMLDVALAANAGDPAARARLAAWQEVVLRYEPQMARLSARAGSGDANAAQELQALQVNLFREWSRMPSTRKPAKPR